MAVSFVAEVSSNHHQDLDRCFRFIDRAAAIQCDAVKFQLFRIDELFAPEILRKSEKHRQRKAWELPVSFLPELHARCREKNIQFSCTPFYLKAVDELHPYVDFYKIASYELLWDGLLQAVASTGKPVVLSTGMATMEEIRRAVGVLSSFGCEELTLLHCTSSYPTPTSECNLAAIVSMREELGVPVGWSDHSARPGVIFRAVHRFEAAMVEFHLDLEGEGEEFDAGHCWLPESIAKVISNVREGMEADGSGVKEPVKAEFSDRDWRADPSDGLRPLEAIRKRWRE